ncbi:MAG: hypothetical protein K9L68_13045 [Spirochaetales bacterium]|nr:hypothetical protein [Spirochaetales bacterium]
MNEKEARQGFEDAKKDFLKQRRAPKENHSRAENEQRKVQEALEGVKDQLAKLQADGGSDSEQGKLRKQRDKLAAELEEKSLLVKSKTGGYF